MNANKEFKMTQETFDGWVKELQGVQQKIGELNKQQFELIRKIEAVNILFGQQVGNAAQQQSTTITIQHAPAHQQQPQNANVAVTPKEVAKQSLPDAILAIFTATGDKRTATEIKTALNKQGITNLGSRDAYFYTVLARLKEKGQLTKEGNFYKRNFS